MSTHRSVGKVHANREVQIPDGWRFMLRHSQRIAKVVVREELRGVVVQGTDLTSVR